ncbi:outer membrane beta-barrel protein [Bradyrhizobium jicamae]|uniref:outer membrane beta-barrel protein n=1 Tax=Bradyrhizobium jicamae TaxID=280332 RepID=UPI001BABA0E2|nr:outer membrane beta-barrel protein [Bradyrhizobium jicamae]MBR0932302.1 outer membrane beta-barrel protein [Bradyrhizobium jicamae]
MKMISAATFALALTPGFAFAADMPEIYRAPPVLWSWTGFYVGGHVGAASWNSSFSDPSGSSIFGGTVRTSAISGGGQIGYNWQVPASPFVLGIEADADLIGGNGSGTCFASSGFFISANCRVRPDTGGSFTGRLGYATGRSGRTLLYVKGGVAWLDERIDSTTNGVLPYAVSSLDDVRWGWTAGAGVERALTPAWSFRLEYDYAKFDNVGMATPTSFLQVLPPAFAYVPTASAVTNVSQNLQTVKVGLNYKFGQDIDARWQPSEADYHLRGTADAPFVPEAEVEIGGRVWYSSGRFQKDLSTTRSQTMPGLLVSRLTYDTTAASGELFGRIDTASNIFVKGFVGGGKILSGNMHDEDWGIFNLTVPYSNTQSTVSGDLAYGTFDVGYSLFRGPSANVGGFVGFNYYEENKSAYGCRQIANPFSDCVPAIPNSTLGITEDDKWYSLRIGVNGVVTLADRLKLTADAAYLPYVAFRGTDNHLLRTDVANTISPESGAGQGVQVEAVLSYAVSDAFNVGAGARYWAMWAPSAYTNGFSTPCPCQGLPVSTERYGGFLQASYKFGGPAIASRDH